MLNRTDHDNALEQRLKERFSQQPFLDLIGAELGLVQPGLVEFRLPFDARLTQQDGFLHAGVVTALVDTACGYAAFSMMAPHSRVLTVEYKINFVSPASGERFLARGMVLKAGKTITTCEGKVYAYQGEAEKLVAVMQATMIRVSEMESI